ncbi:unknown [Firmicutes bacterium CAG:137]|nr:unknown [Firmicutes bacterium CAG:137]
MVICSIHRAGFRVHHGLTGSQIFHLNAGSSGVADDGNGELADLVAVFAVDSGPFRQIACIRHHRIAAKEIPRAGVVGIGDGGEVGVGATQIGQPHFAVCVVLQSGAHLKHGPVAPVTVEAQHRNGVLRALGSLCRSAALGVHKALYVSARGILIVQRRLLSIGQLHRHLHICRAVGRNRHALAHIEGHIRVQHGRPGVHVIPLVPILVDHIGEHALGEEIGGQRIGLLHIRQVVDGEGKGVIAGSGRVISQLHFYLAIGIGLVGVCTHENVGICGNGLAHIGQTRALAQDGIVAVTFLAPILQLGDRSGHEEALGQNPGGEAGFLGQATLPDVLGHQGHHAGHLRCGHGGTGHVLIGGPAGNQTIDRVNVAPWSSDLRLHLQGAGNAPAGEVAHGVILFIPDLGANPLLHG